MWKSDHLESWIHRELKRCWLLILCLSNWNNLDTVTYRPYHSSSMMCQMMKMNSNLTSCMVCGWRMFLLMNCAVCNCLYTLSSSNHLVLLHFLVNFHSMVLQRVHDWLQSLEIGIIKTKISNILMKLSPFHFHKILTFIHLKVAKTVKRLPTTFNFM